jgi:ABC-type transport system involved in multi-copper enzyme maturation permease subunit
MPIHDQSYRHWEGELKSHTFRWWAITVEGLKVLLRRKLFVIFILAPAIIQFLVFGGMIYGVNTYTFFMNMNFITPEFFYKFCMRQSFFIALICVFAGSGLIANDLRSNAFQLYLSKPLTRLDYILGKFAIMLIMLGFITLIPGILLFIEHSVLSQDSTFFLEQYWIFGSITLFSLILIIPTMSMILAFSSITKSYRYSAIMFMAIIFGTPVIGTLLREILRVKWANYIQYWWNMENMGRELFGISKTTNTWYWSALIMIIITVISIVVIHRRIKGVDIVK